MNKNGSNGRPCGCLAIAGSLGRARFQTRKEVAAAVDVFEMVSQNSPRPNLLQHSNEIPLGFHSFRASHERDSQVPEYS